MLVGELKEPKMGFKEEKQRVPRTEDNLHEETSRYLSSSKFRLPDMREVGVTVTSYCEREYRRVQMELSHGNLRVMRSR